jgi:hypothetical protein
MDGELLTATQMYFEVGSPEDADRCLFGVKVALPVHLET